MKAKPDIMLSDIFRMWQADEARYLDAVKMTPEEMDQTDDEIVDEIRKLSGPFAVKMSSLPLLAEGDQVRASVTSGIGAPENRSLDWKRTAQVAQAMLAWIVLNGWKTQLSVMIVYAGENCVFFAGGKELDDVQVLRSLSPAVTPEAAKKA